MNVERTIFAAFFSIAVTSTYVLSQDYKISPDETARQFADPQGTVALVQTSEFIRVVEARQRYSVDGLGLKVAVLDTGINRSHVDFDGKIDVEKNYTLDNGGKDDDAADGNGHGTNVCGIVVADGDHKGIALGAKIIPIKVMTNAGVGSWSALIKALNWIDQNHEAKGISVVNLSIGVGNFQSSKLGGEQQQVEDLIVRLRGKKVVTVVAAGNDYFKAGKTQGEGMAFPAICKGTVSVGAVYDANVGPCPYLSGAIANTTAAGRITPFSQRLHPSVSADFATDVFAPGAPLTSSGIEDAHGESIQHGTSQAAPVTAGVVLLLQEYYKRVTGELPTVDQIEAWLHSGVRINDGDDEDDNTQHTGKDFIRLDAMMALGAADGELRGKLLRQGKLKK